MKRTQPCCWDGHNKVSKDGTSSIHYLLFISNLQFAALPAIESLDENSTYWGTVKRRTYGGASIGRRSHSFAGRINTKHAKQHNCKKETQCRQRVKERQLWRRSRRRPRRGGRMISKGEGRVRKNVREMGVVV